MRLKSVAAKNFKAVGACKAEVELPGLTVLVGRNDAGKSTLLEALAFLSDRATPGQSFGLQGQNVSFDDFREMVHRADVRRAVAFELVFELDKSELASVVAAKAALDRSDVGFGERLQKQGIYEATDGAMGVRDIGLVLSGLRHAYAGLSRDGLLSVDLLVADSARKRRLTIRNSSGDQVWESLTGEDVWNVLAVPSLVHGLAIEQGPSSEAVFGKLWGRDNMQVRVEGRVETDIRSSFSTVRFPTEYSFMFDVIVALEAGYLSALRAIRYVRDPRPLLKSTFATAQASPTVGRTPEELGSFATMLLQSSHQRDAKSKLVDWADKFGIHNISSAWAGTENKFTMEFDDPDLDVTLGVGSLGFGSKQLLPILLQGLTMPLGGLFLIEEPEMGLHPDRQLQLLEALADMVSAGVTVVFTTHSPTMMLGLGSLVKEKRISSDRMAAYWVEKNAEGTSCSRLPMSEHGYIHGWVKSFAEVEQTLMKDWLTTLVKPE